VIVQPPIATTETVNPELAVGLTVKLAP